MALFSIILLAGNVHAQIIWEEHTINGNLDGAQIACAADLDNDVDPVVPFWFVG